MDLLTNLRAFSSATEHGSLSRSAAALGVATSVRNRQIVSGHMLNHTGRPQRGNGFRLIA